MKFSEINDAARLHTIVPFKPNFPCPKCCRLLVPKFGCTLANCYRGIEHLHWKCGTCGFGELITKTCETCRKKKGQ